MVLLGDLPAFRAFFRLVSYFQTPVTHHCCFIAAGVKEHQDVDQAVVSVLRVGWGNVQS